MHALDERLIGACLECQRSFSPFRLPVSLLLRPAPPKMPDGWDKVDASVTAKRTSNPIRKIIDQLAAKPNPDLKLISLSIGDPTVYGNLPPPEVAIEALNEQARGGKRNGCVRPPARLRASSSAPRWTGGRQHAMQCASCII